ncbi:hypothetical protein FNT36_21775 [Hymenobacter setariae]|uniref:Adhesin domain-containing protein n=1 Tax=Hymenobacter setariae TaxID=2594794 RepID=A0A558BMR9_9BACT|nr:hypothetical protein [Hymenobacter setariae]TVT37800.1 hypothetical protein FNT36_21775 [Hymenobacter setariae]
MKQLSLTWLSGWGLLVAWLMVGPAWAQAPRTVQVVTRTVSQTLDCPAGTVVRIRADRATVRVQGWDQPTLRVVLRLSARHPERAVAEKDLPTAQYRISPQAGAIDLVNYQTLAAGTPAPASDLRADYTIFMPAANALQVANTYGQTQLIGLTGRQKLTQDFGQVELRQLRGSLDATVHYADLTGSDLQLAFTCQAEKSALVLKTIAGGYAIRNRYGSIRLEPTPELTGINIDAERTEITMLPPPLTQFNYQLAANHGTLSVPSTYPDAGGNRTSWRSTGAERRPLVRILTTYASLTLQPSAGALLSHP